ncbi:MAG: NPCBM/NEW2 domain-containing protein [Actinomycetota bacterium]
MNGELYVGTLVTDFGSSGDDECSLEYDLGRSWTRLTGLIGIQDLSDVDATVRLRLILDGSSVLELTVGVGETSPFDLDVRDALRLRMVVTRIEGEVVGVGIAQSRLTL